MIKVKKINILNEAKFKTNELYLSVLSNNNNLDKNSIELIANIKNNIMGEELIQTGLVVSSKEMNNSIKIDIIKNYLKSIEENCVTICFTAQLKEKTEKKEAMIEFTDAISYLVNKHGGKIIFSGLIERTSIWDFDFIGFAQFPFIESIQAIFFDPELMSSAKIKGSMDVFDLKYSISNLELIK